MYYRIQESQTEVKIGTENKSYCWVDTGQGPRSGLSVCGSLEDLKKYFAHDLSGMVGGRLPASTISSWELIELEGVESDDMDHDHDHIGSPILIHPTKEASRRKLTIDEVVEFCWLDEDAGNIHDLKIRMNELLDGGYTPKQVESAALIAKDIARLDECEDSISDLYDDVDGKRMIGMDGNWEQLVFSGSRYEIF